MKLHLWQVEQNVCSLKVISTPSWVFMPLRLQSLIALYSKQLHCELLRWWTKKAYHVLWPIASRSLLHLIWRCCTSHLPPKWERLTLVSVVRTCFEIWLTYYEFRWTVWKYPVEQCHLLLAFILNSLTVHINWIHQYLSLLHLQAVVEIHAVLHSVLLGHAGSVKPQGNPHCSKCWFICKNYSSVGTVGSIGIFTYVFLKFEENEHFHFNTLICDVLIS